MPREHPPETVFQAQELYCVERLTATATAQRLRINVKTVYRWRDQFHWDEKREKLAQAECEIRVDLIMARSVMLKELIKKKGAQTAFAVAALENLAMQQAEAERTGKALQAALEAPKHEIRGRADAAKALEKTIESKLSIALASPGDTDVLQLARQIKDALNLLDQIRPTEDEQYNNKSQGLSAELEEKIRNLI